MLTIGMFDPITDELLFTHGQYHDDDRGRAVARRAIEVYYEEVRDDPEIDLVPAILRVSVDYGTPAVKH